MRSIRLVSCLIPAWATALASLLLACGPRAGPVADALSRGPGFDAGAPADNNRVLLFGGFGSDGAPRDATSWVFDGSSWTGRSVSPNPGVRFGAMAAAHQGAVVLFGGVRSDTPGLADTWTWTRLI